MLFTAQRQPFTNVINGLGMAMLVLSATVLTPARAEAEPKQRQPLMALLEPEPIEAEPGWPTIERP